MTEAAIGSIVLALPQVPGFLVFVVCLLGPVALLGAGLYALTAPTLGRQYLAVATLPLLLAGLLVAYVFGEDTYRGDGISRWDAYRSPGGELGELFVLTIVALVGCAVAPGYASLRGRRWLFAAWAFVTVFGAGFLAFATIIGFSNN
jgi:hypothetical protein